MWRKRNRWTKCWGPYDPTPTVCITVLSASRERSSPTTEPDHTQRSIKGCCMVPCPPLRSTYYPDHEGRGQKMLPATVRAASLMNTHGHVATIGTMLRISEYVRESRMHTRQTDSRVPAWSAARAPQQNWKKGDILAEANNAERLRSAPHSIEIRFGSTSHCTAQTRAAHLGPCAWQNQTPNS